MGRAQRSRNQRRKIGLHHEGPARLRRNQNEKSRIHHEGTKDTKVFVGCASRTGRSRNISRKGAKEEHCHFERREKSFLDTSPSLGMTCLGPVTWRLGAINSPSCGAMGG